MVKHCLVCWICLLILNLAENGEIKSSKSELIKIRYPNAVMVMISFV